MQGNRSGLQPLTPLFTRDQGRIPDILRSRASRAIRAKIGPPESMPLDEHVYFVRCMDYVKIGYSSHPPSRAHAMTTDNPFSVELLGSTPGTRVTERIMQRQFAKWHHRNEWYRLTKGLMRAIEELCRD